MAEEEDALGSFFAEIEKIESEQPKSSHDDSEPTAEIAMKPAMESKVISKPAEISQKKTSHTVYTYVAPASANGEQYDTSGQQHAGGSSGSTGNNGAPGGSTAFSFHSAHSISQFQATSKNTASRPPLPLTAAPDKKFVRKAAGEVWVDSTLNEWPENDYRIFVGDLAKEITTSDLDKTFRVYPSFAKAKVSYLFMSCHA
jgi:hypothetical protein